MANFGMEKVYQEFEPLARWTSEPDAEILVVDLPGFKKEQLKVAVTATRKLRLIGERPIGGNKWIRLHQEIPVPLTLDIASVSATLKDNKLYIRHPKVKTQVPQTQPPVTMKPHDQNEKKQDLGEAKGPLSSKDHEEKDKAGAKWLDKYKEVTGNMVKEAKNKRQLVCNLAGSILLVLLIILYARNAVRSSLVWDSDE